MKFKLLNLLKTFTLSLVIFTNCSSVKLVDGLINGLSIKVKVLNKYIKPRIETIAFERKESPTLRQIQTLCSNPDFTQNLYDESSIEIPSPSQETLGQSHTDEDPISDWDEELSEREEQTSQIELKIFDLGIIDSDFFTIEVWNKLKKEFSVICYKSKMLRDIEYYTIIITPIFSKETIIKLIGYRCRLEGKENPTDNRILQIIELQALTRKFVLLER